MMIEIHPAVVAVFLLVWAIKIIRKHRNRYL